MDNRIRTVSVLLAVMMTMLGGGLAHAQSFGKALSEDIRLDWSVARGARGRTSQVISITSAAANVRLQVEALDASGNVIGSNSGFVFGNVPPANRSYFGIPVPGSGASSYRVTVQTLDWRMYRRG